ncbi:MAG TPA: AEC family transporter [Alphaproteobacteria bacterium]|nr:AEC family transporter [Alphaproteobacteria bacterium]
MFPELFNIVAPVVVCAAIGYGWARLGLPFETPFVASLVTNIAAPCLILATLTKLNVSAEAFGQMAGAAVLAILIFMVIGAIVLRAAKLSLHSFLPAMMFGNTGNMGLPLTLFAFGEEGLALGIAFFAVNAVSQFTVGALISSGSMSIRRLVRTPVLWAVSLALIFMFTGAKPPTFIASTLTLLGNIAIGLMLLALGVSLARLKVRSLGHTFGLSVLRLGMGFGVGFGLAYALGLEGAARGVVILDCAMPVAVFNYLFAQRYGREAEEVASVIVASTLISFATLPLLLLVVL